MKKLLVALAASCLAAVPGHAYVITFSGAPSGAFTSTTEGGFNVTALTGGLSLGSRGVPAPSLLTSALGASFQVTSASGQFKFSSFAVDLNSTDTDDSSFYTVTGFLGGTQVFTQGDVEFGSLGNTFTTVASASAATIDRLVFTQTSANPGFLFDNIDVSAVGSPAGVPEPATWGMMVAGFGLVGCGLRSRRRGAGVSFA